MASYDGSTTNGAAASRYSRRKANGRIAMTCEFDAETDRRLEARALREERSKAAVVRIAVREYCDRADAAEHSQLAE